MGREKLLLRDLSYLLYGGGTSFVVTIVTFKLIGPALSSRITPLYKLLPKYVKADWNSRVLSNMNAAVSLAFSFYSLLYETGMRDDVVWYDSYYARTSVSLIMGYMLGDIVLMLLWCNLKRGELLRYIFHHAVAIYGYYFVSVYGIMCFYSMLRLVAELSTPPVNQRWFFDTLDVPRSSMLVIINGLLMVLTFFLSRICIMPFFWYEIWMVTGTEAVLRQRQIQFIMYFPCLVLDGLNLYWFHKMCKGFIKALTTFKCSANKANALSVDAADKTNGLKLKSV